MAATRRNRPADRSERPFGPVSGLCFALLMLAAVAGPCAAQGWPEHGGPGGIHYSSLAQIDRSNVHELVLAWTYRTGEGAGPLTEAGHFGLQVTPILLPEAAGGHLVLCSPLNRVIALDPATGRERWRFDPEVRRLGPDDQPKCRGVAQWRDAELDAGALCAWRIFVATLDQRLLALDGRTGRACESFGQDGVVELAAFIDATMPATDTASVRTYMPPAIISDKVIVGSSVGAKFRRADAPSGAVRAFDARTGRLAWSFDAVPRTADDPAAADWTPEAQKQTGGANVWSLMSVDPGRDMVFLPTSSASPNFFGGTRPGNNRHANSVVALRGSTGELVWSFQLVHHDVWDWDVASQPLLVDLQRNGQRIPVVVQLTKQGLVFVFHRETGVPVFPVEERPVPVDGVPGDALSPTQPFPVAPPPLAPMSIEPDDAWGFSFYDRLACRRMIEALRHGEAYTPPTVRGTVIRSGMVSNWGAGAFDESRNVLITNAQSLPSLIRLVPDDQVEAGQTDAPMAGLPGGPPGRIAGTEYAVQRGVPQLFSPFGAPCTRPPWYSLVAVDLAAGSINWSVPLGTLETMMPVPIPLPFGAPGIGGPIVTAGGLAFIGATADERFRAFDVDTGEVLWSRRLPTAAMATPMTYAVDGRQFVVIAAGGHHAYYRRKVGDYLLGFALPAD